MELTGLCIEVLGGLDLHKRAGHDGQSTESRRGINHEVVAHTYSRDKLSGGMSAK